MKIQKKATALMKHTPKKRGSEASMKYTRVEGIEASLPVTSPGLHSLFYLRIQRSNKNTRKLRRTVNVSGEARLLARILLSVHMGNFCAVDRSIKYREQNQSENINFHVSLATVV